MLTGLRIATISDPDRFDTLKVMYPPPSPENLWGVLLPLKDTEYAAHIPVVTGEALSHAFHGRVKPLRGQLGKPPIQRARALPKDLVWCQEWHQKICANMGPSCFAGSGAVPECFYAPVEDRDLQRCLSAVLRAWDEGRYVFLVEGPEFVVR
jgi:hypothetical protein